MRSRHCINTGKGAEPDFSVRNKSFSTPGNKLKEERTEGGAEKEKGMRSSNGKTVKLVELLLRDDPNLSLEVDKGDTGECEVCRGNRNRFRSKPETVIPREQEKENMKKGATRRISKFSQHKLRE